MATACTDSPSKLNVASPVLAADSAGDGRAAAPRLRQGARLPDDDGFAFERCEAEAVARILAEHPELSR